jgi:uncharacterized membrane protein
MGDLEADGWVTKKGDQWVFAVPRKALLKQAALQGLLLPLLLVLVCFALVLVAEGDPRASLPSVLGCGLLALVGMGQAALGALRSKRLAERSTVTVALAERQLKHADGVASTDGVLELVVRQANSWQKWLAIDAILAPTATPATGPFAAPSKASSWRLLTRIPPQLGPEAAGTLRELGAALGVPVHVEGGVDRGSVLGMGPGTTAVFCYLPFQGLFLVASVGVLLVSRDPELRFHARQSLVLFVAELLAFVGCGVAGGVVALVSTDAGIVVGALLFVAVALLRLVVRIGCCFLAQKVTPFRIPGIGRLVALPEPLQA